MLLFIFSLVGCFVGCIVVMVFVFGLVIFVFVQDGLCSVVVDMVVWMDVDMIMVGVGVVNLFDYEGLNSNCWIVVLVVIGLVDGFGFQVLGNCVSIDLIFDKVFNGFDFQVGLIGVLNFNCQSLKNIDDVCVCVFGKVKIVIEVGGYVGVGKIGVIISLYDKLLVMFSYCYDVNNVYDSVIWQLIISYLVLVSIKVVVVFFVLVEYVGEGYVDIYFSIMFGQSVVSMLLVYNVSSGWKIYMLGGVVMYLLIGDLFKGFKVIVGGIYVCLFNDFVDSLVMSIVGLKGQWFGVVGVVYIF